MFTFFKRLFCLHEYKMIYSFFRIDFDNKGKYYQSQIIRSICTKCGKIKDSRGGKY